MRQTRNHDDADILDQVITVRLATELRRRISREARTRGTSISEEIRRRLARSFGQRTPEAAGERA